ncbi:MAG TPA: CAP domain-containing protein, partial [Chloroflexota bacterium]|nr:CAP domain-containing protein [Chloroflexota bacterium]
MPGHLVRIALAVLLITASVATNSLTAASVSAAVAEDQVIDIVNRVRTERGLTTVTSSPQLTTAAHRYATYMASAGFFSHTGLDGSTMESRIEAAGYTGWTFIAENLAAGQSSSGEVVDAWLNSSGHRENIMSPHVREMGVAYVYRSDSPYGHYWVQLFG